MLGRIMDGPDDTPRNNATWKVNMMKILWIIPIGTALALGACAQNTETTTDTGTTTTTLVSLDSETVEVGCAMCVYDMDGVSSCRLAAKVGDNPVLVSGVEVDLHDHGLCEACGTAVMSGHLDGDMLVATSVEMQ